MVAQNLAVSVFGVIGAGVFAIIGALVTIAMIVEGKVNTANFQNDLIAGASKPDYSVDIRARIDIPHEQDAGLWYPVCKAGHDGVATRCYQDCDPGFVDDGLLCRRPPDSFGKPSYQRGVEILQCAPGLVNDAGLCYTPCPPGWRGVATLCYAECPTGTVEGTRLARIIFRDDGLFCFKLVSDLRARFGYPWQIRRHALRLFEHHPPLRTRPRCRQLLDGGPDRLSELRARVRHPRPAVLPAVSAGLRRHRDLVRQGHVRPGYRRADQLVRGRLRAVRRALLSAVQPRLQQPAGAAQHLHVPGAVPGGIQRHRVHLPAQPLRLWQELVRPRRRASQPTRRQGTPGRQAGGVQLPGQADGRRPGTGRPLHRRNTARHRRPRPACPPGFALVDAAVIGVVRPALRPNRHATADDHHRGDDQVRHGRRRR